MPPTTPPLDFDHEPGYEIPTKHKEAIRQLYGFAKIPIEGLMERYHLGRTTIVKILEYEKPERARRKRGSATILSDSKVDEIIEYLSTSWNTRKLDWTHLCAELNLPYAPITLAKRLKQRGYFRCTACQKPYLTAAQVLSRFIWAITHIFWTVEWLKVLWSDEVTFLVGGRTSKQKVTRKRGERTCETCIQHQFYRGYITAVSAWGAIGYGYKSPLTFVTGTGKSSALKQVDYLSQVLEPHIRPILKAFAVITH